MDTTIDIEQILKDGEYHPLQEQIVNILRARTDNPSVGYFRIVTAFHLAEIASAMRCKVRDKTFCPDPVPVNLYGCILMPSGAGKNFSNGILENKIVGKFKNRFLYTFLPMALDENLTTMADKKMAITGLDRDECKRQLIKESDSYGELLYCFDSATAPAFKQARAKAQMCNAGALNYICDEIGTNITNPTSKEVVPVVLEMFDTGSCKSKLIKNSSDNKRFQDRHDAVPVNVLWFGTPVALLNGGSVEDAFYAMLETGFARRMLFASGEKVLNLEQTPEEYIASKAIAIDDSECDQIASNLESLAEFYNHNVVLTVEDQGTLLLAYYRKWCLERSAELNEQATIEQAELTNRILKTLKLAGIYAFVDKATTITAKHIVAALKVVEDSGKYLKELLHREESFIKLAKYLAKTNEETTKADLTTKLPYFKNCPAASQKEMIERACEWGYKHSIIIKQYQKGAVSFIKGETLEATDLNKIVCSYSNHEAYYYKNSTISWSQLEVFGKTDGIHWVNHHLSENPSDLSKGSYRNEECVIPGFNLLVLDMDDGTTLDWAREVLKEYTYLIYTTKRHQPNEHRFRIVLPMTYKLYLSKDDYKQFMLNVYDSLPFKGIDKQTAQRSRKWLSNKGTIFTNTGALFDPRPFMPNTSQNQARIDADKAYGNVDNIDRWFLKNISNGNRNNMLYRYGKLLQEVTDANGNALDDKVIERRILDLNRRLEAPLNDVELRDTVLQSIYH